MTPTATTYPDLTITSRSGARAAAFLLALRIDSGDDWRISASCAKVGDPDLWHPDDSGNPTKLVKRICARCPVLTECRDWILANEDNANAHGFWAGMSARQRVMARQKARQDRAAA